jgi:TfoX/Sxy family transcriptional regulator of competence genes
MACNEKLTQRVRTALSDLPKVEEKKMFGGIAFMVNGKMCINISKNRIMFRIDPELHNIVTKKKGCRTVEMGGRKYKGYVYVNENNIKSKKDLDYWIGLALDFNKRAKASRKAVHSDKKQK